MELLENAMAKRAYPWGEEEDATRANYDKTGIGSISAAGCFSSGAGPYGAEELAGNVWEWTRSLYSGYPYDPADGREELDASGGEVRVLRGGSFNYNDRSVRCAARRGGSLDFGSRSGGFRFVASPSTSGL